MIVKFFKRGGVADNRYSLGGRAVQRYLLGKDYADGVASRANARFLEGNPAQVTELINGLAFSKIYTAGCLAFEGEESQSVTEAMKRELMAAFEQCLFTGLDKHQYAGYWVEHTDKIDTVTQTPRLELNFVFANVELTTGKALPVYYHPIDCARVDCFKELNNLRMNLTDPNAIQRKRMTRVKDNLPQQVKDTVMAIDNQLSRLFADNKVHHRDEVIAYLSSHYEITAIKNQSISIKNPHGGTRPIRLQGAFYEKAFESRQSLSLPSVTDYQRHTDCADSERLSKLKAEYQRLCDKRAIELGKRFAPKSPMPVASRLAVENTGLEQVNEQTNKVAKMVAGSDATADLSPSRPDPVTIGQQEQMARWLKIFHRPPTVMGEADNVSDNTNLNTPANSDPAMSSAAQGGQRYQQERAGNLTRLDTNAIWQIADSGKVSDEQIINKHLSGSGSAYQPRMQPLGEGIDVTESSKFTARTGISAAIRAVVERATTAIRGVQNAIRKRQSVAQSVGELIGRCHRAVRNVFDKRAEQSSHAKHTNQRTAYASRAVSEACDTLDTAVSSLSASTGKTFGTTVAGVGRTDLFQSSVDGEQRAVARPSTGVDGSQSTVTAAKRDSVSEIERLDRCLSTTREAIAILREAREHYDRERAKFLQCQREREELLDKLFGKKPSVAIEDSKQTRAVTLDKPALDNEDFGPGF